MKLRTAFFIAASFVSGPAVGSPQPYGYYTVMFNADSVALISGGWGEIDGISHAKVFRGYQFDVTDNAKNFTISAHDRTLSDHRAKAVVARLVVDGIPKSMIKICYIGNYGSAYSAIQGPCEPQNHKVVVFMPFTQPPPPPPGVIILP